MSANPNRLLSGIVGPLKTYSPEELRAAVEAEREACCRDVCERCRNGGMLIANELTGEPCHEWRIGRQVLLVACAAASIRARAAKEGHPDG